MAALVEGAELVSHLLGVAFCRTTAIKKLSFYCQANNWVTYRGLRLGEVLHIYTTVHCFNRDRTATSTESSIHHDYRQRCSEGIF